MRILPLLQAILKIAKMAKQWANLAFMRYALAVTVIALAMLPGCASDQPIPSQNTNSAVQPSKEHLIGHWVCNDGIRMAELTFSPDGKLVFVINGRRLGGEWGMTYMINTNTYPWEVDCLATNPTNAQTNTVRTLIEMINNYTIRMAMDDNPKVVPWDFTSNNSITLVKQ